jgi:hypothetical protein
MGELAKIFNDDKLVMSAQDTIVAYKIFSVLETLFRNSEKCLKFIFNNFNEEFRFVFCYNKFLVLVKNKFVVLLQILF